MKAQINIASISTMIAITSLLTLSPANAQNTGEILIIPENSEEVSSKDGIKFSKNGDVLFPSGETIKVNLNLNSSNNSVQESDGDQDK